jgi:hypothetical protein
MNTINYAQTVNARPGSAKSAKNVSNQANVSSWGGETGGSGGLEFEKKQLERMKQKQVNLSLEVY